MRLRSGGVAVKQLPETLTAKQGRAFFRELESCLNIDRPYIVLDCSKVRAMDGSAIHFLLCCLEEAMKRNGDVKLSAVSSEAREILKLTASDRLFKIFDSNDEAVNSFYHRPVHGHYVTAQMVARESTAQNVAVNESATQSSAEIAA